jgi:hypothetical protein
MRAQDKNERVRGRMGICVNLTMETIRSAGRVAPEGRISRPSGPVRSAPSLRQAQRKGFDTLSAEFILSSSKGFELPFNRLRTSLNRRSLKLTHMGSMGEGVTG